MPKLPELTPEKKEQLAKALKAIEKEHARHPFRDIKVMAIPEDVRHDLEVEARLRDMEAQIAQLKERVDQLDARVEILKYR